MGLDLHPARRDGNGGWDWGSEGAPVDRPWPQWSYGGFSLFRERLARAEGFELDVMRGFGGPREWDSVSTELEPLLNHSDCDGEMTPDQCRRVLPRLHEIVAGWAATDPGDYDARAGAELCRAMEMCVTEDMGLLFR